MFWASRAPAVIASAVAVPAIDSERWTSAESDLTWLAASVDALTSVIWASRAPDRIDAAVALPAADSVRSTSAASALIWLAASSDADHQGRLRLAGAGQDRIGGTGADGGERALDFGRGQLELRADVGGDVSSACCAARAPVWMVSVVLTTRLVSERSASSTCDLMPERQHLGARHQVVAGLAAAALDAAGDGLDARAEQILELRDAGVDVVGDRADAALDALVDFLEARRDGVGEVGAAAVDGLGDAGDAVVDRLRSPGRCRRSARR